MTKIHVIGIGLDGAAGLTESVRQIVEKATLLIGSDRHLAYFPSHPAPRLVLGDFHLAIAQMRNLIAKSDKNYSIIVLVSGDPLFFGLGRLLLEELPPEEIVFYPHISSIQLAFSRLKVPWQDAVVISCHGRSLDTLTQALKEGVEKIAVLTDSINTPIAIANLILSLDLSTRYGFWVCENLGGIDEKVQFLAIDTVCKENFSSLNIVILIRQSDRIDLEINIDNLPIFGLSDETFLSFRDRPSLMTKREVRTLLLGELALQPGQIVWDIGAGTGSVSIEIARLCPKSQVYAIEKTAMGTSLIEQNCRRFQVKNVVSIHGNAPDILENLPTPNRIFIGGSGGNLSAILDECQLKLAPNGIIVLAFATLEHLHQALSWLKEHHWEYTLLQIQLSRSISVAQLTRFTPLNPVTIVTGKLIVDS